jgi:hypothetical protein
MYALSMRLCLARTRNIIPYTPPYVQTFYAIFGMLLMPSIGASKSRNLFKQGLVRLAPSPPKQGKKLHPANE